MSIAKSADHSQARAIIIAALIGSFATIAAAILGAKAGEHRAEEGVRKLEKKLEDQGKGIKELEAQIRERDKSIQTLAAQLEQRGQTSQSQDLRVSREEQAHDSFEVEQISDGARSQQASAVIAKRLPPFDISLIKCEHWGSGLACGLLFKNTGTAAAYIAIDNRSSFAYDESGGEYKLEEATLGSRRWSAGQFGAIGLEPGIPVAARFEFTAVPQSVHRGHLRLVLAVLPTGNSTRVWGMQVDWNSLVLDGVPFV